MDIASILEEYLADISTLPGDVSFILDEIKIKDMKLLEAQRRISQRDGAIQKYVQSNGAMPEFNKEQNFYPKIRSDFQECILLQQEKYRLAAMGLYLVTKHVLKLDAHVANLEAEGVLPPVEQDSDDQGYTNSNHAHFHHRTTSSVGHSSTHSRSSSVSHHADTSHSHNRRESLSVHANVDHRRPNSESSRRNSRVQSRHSRSSSIAPETRAAAAQTAAAAPPTAPSTANTSNYSNNSTSSNHNVSDNAAGETNSAAGSANDVANREAKPSATTASAGGSAGNNQGSSPSGSPKPAGGSVAATSGAPASRKSNDETESATENKLKRSAEARQRPTEETDESFCFCKKGSVGNMIACDGDNCEIEWFHWDCVGLTEDPKGQWYCTQCREKIKRAK